MAARTRTAKAAEKPKPPQPFVARPPFVDVRRPDGTVYRVTYPGCPCKDFLYRDEIDKWKTCKHMRKADERVRTMSALTGPVAFVDVPSETIPGLSYRVTMLNCECGGTRHTPSGRQLCVDVSAAGELLPPGWRAPEVDDDSNDKPKAA